MNEIQEYLDGLTVYGDDAMKEGDLMLIAPGAVNVLPVNEDAINIEVSQRTEDGRVIISVSIPLPAMRIDGAKAVTARPAQAGAESEEA